MHQSLDVSLKRLCIINWKKKRKTFHECVQWSRFDPNLGTLLRHLGVCVSVGTFHLSCYSWKGYRKGPVRTPVFLIDCDWINFFSLWAAIAENYKPVKSCILLKKPLALIFLISFHHLLCFCRAATQLGLWRARLILQEPLTLPTINMSLSNY